MTMIPTNQFSNGITLRVNGDLFDLVFFEFVKPGKGAAFVRTKLKNLKTGGVKEVTFDSKDKVEQVLTNLISNALRHSPLGGRVNVRARRAAPGVEVTVSDTGEGIRAQDLPHIFERFYRGDAARSRQRGAGAGLGLAIARGIVRAHGGEIRVESEPGQGTQFTFYLPE